MGSIRNVACPCGFKSPVTVGGSMRNFLEDSRFPFYCETCGIVDVNVAKDDLYCPKCESRDVKQYGIPPISEPASGWDKDNFIELKKGIESAGFQLLGDAKLSSKFVYFDAAKPL